jgi:hypothetical protein
MKDTKRYENFFSADSTPLPVLRDVEVEIKIGGGIVPTIVAVVEGLGFDLILGMDFFREAHAVVDMRTNTLTLFDGLTAVPMSATGEHPVVATTMPVVIPPMSEAVLPVDEDQIAQARLRYRRRPTHAVPRAAGRPRAGPGRQVGHYRAES